MTTIISKNHSRTISVDNFHVWTKKQHYRTSYASQYQDFPELPKNVASPGYQGFIPYVNSSSMYGKGFSPMTRIALNNPKLAENTFGLATTGLNVVSKVHIDNAAEGISHKYGHQTIQKYHPCLNTEKWATQQREDFRNPKQLIAPTYHETNKFLQTGKELTKLSGFTSNHQSLDGQGWKPDPILQSDQTRTQYRIEFNEEKPVQRDPTIFKLRKLRKIEYNHKST